jgi:urease accessory protein
MNGVLLQLSDSAFPAGAFAHSAGLEALHHLGQLKGEAAVRARLAELAWHTASGALPFLNDAFSGDAQAADVACECFVSNHVARRASIAQGRAFVLAAEAMFEAPLGPFPHSHLPVVFGALARAQSISLDDARQCFLFSAVRSGASAAVRLGAIGPLRAQATLRALHPTLDEALARTRASTALDAAGTSPWLETAQASHDELYSRLFQS